MWFKGLSQMNPVLDGGRWWSRAPGASAWDMAERQKWVQPALSTS